MVDILFLAKNRAEFTDLALDCLIQNTPWERVRSLWLYDDESEDGTAATIEYGAKSLPASVSVYRTRGKFGNPVAVMNHFILKSQFEPVSPAAEFIAKIDNDTCVPQGWLQTCLTAMNVDPELMLLGIEPMHGRAEAFGESVTRTVEASSHIGGIGIMRRRAFLRKDGTFNLPQPTERFFGFTHFQNMNEQLKRGFLAPPLPVVLLDRLPFEPFRSLTNSYVNRNWSRAWSPYPTDRTDLWSWLISPGSPSGWTTIRL